MEIELQVLGCSDRVRCPSSSAAFATKLENYFKFPQFSVKHGVGASKLHHVTP